MTEVIGDVVIPLELIIPNTTTMPAMSGALILSGAKLWFSPDGSASSSVTSV